MLLPLVHYLKANNYVYMGTAQTVYFGFIEGRPQ